MAPTSTQPVHVLPFPCLRRRSVLHVHQCAEAAWLPRWLECGARLRTLQHSDEARCGVLATESASVRAVLASVLRCARALQRLRHPACNGGAASGHARHGAAGRHRLPLSRAPAQRRAACCTQQCAAKSEVRLIPGPNPNPRFCAARLRIRAVASGAARCTLQRLRSGARAMAPSSSPEALGRCAAVSACTALDHGAAAHSRPLGRRFALRCNFCAAACRPASSPRAATRVQRGPSAPCCREPSLSCVLVGLLTRLAARYPVHSPALTLSGTSVRSPWFEGRRST